MKRLLGFAAASALIALGAPAPALAESLTFIDTEGPGLHVCVSTSAPTSCNGGVASTDTHAFTLNILTDGFIPNSPITSAVLVLDLADDGGSGDGADKLGLVLDGTSIPYPGDANHAAVITLSDVSSLADGKLDVVVSATTGDFFLEGARLTVVDAPASTAAVPAPAALVLLGAGLAGAAWRRRAER